MGAFSDLMLEAKALGAVWIRFSVDLEGYTGEADRNRWTAYARFIQPALPPHLATGRSGEEALRELVAFLRKIGGKDASG